MRFSPLDITNQIFDYVADYCNQRGIQITVLEINSNVHVCCIDCESTQFHAFMNYIVSIKKDREIYLKAVHSL
jgi:hypothetical protein